MTILNKIFAKLYTRAIVKLRGLPVLIVTYQPWKHGKNVIFTSAAPFDSDEYLHTRFCEIGEHIRAEWQGKMDEIMKEKKDGHKDSD